MWTIVLYFCSFAAIFLHRGEAILDSSEESVHRKSLSEIRASFTSVEDTFKELNIIDNLPFDPRDFFHRNFTPLPPLWNEVLPLNRKNFARDNNGNFIIDPWNYMHRMTLYKYFIENIDNCAWHKSLPSFNHSIPINILKKYNPSNIIWGLPLQHGWQFSSKRLFNEENSTTISPDAWWACMNYYLSVIPYLGAMKANLAPPIVIQNIPNAELFCASYDDCPDVVDPWVEFFSYVNITANSCTDGINKDATYEYDGHTPIADRIDFNLTAQMENILQKLWNAHINSIDTALPLFKSQLALLSPPEATFGTAWAGLVDLISDTFFPCDMLYTDLLQNLLPPRILTADDNAPFIKDISRLQNRAVFLIDAIDKADIDSGGKVSSAWADMMCAESTRAYGREMIALGIYRPTILLEDTAAIYKEIQAGVCSNYVL